MPALMALTQCLLASQTPLKSENKAPSEGSRLPGGWGRCPGRGCVPAGCHPREQRRLCCACWCPILNPGSLQSQGMHLFQACRGFHLYSPIFVATLSRPRPATKGIITIKLGCKLFAWHHCICQTAVLILSLNEGNILLISHGGSICSRNQPLIGLYITL